MKLQFIGTGAADFSPLLATDFAEKLDNDARRSSALLIDGRLLIDCGPHVWDSLRLQGVDVSAITDVFVTHFHSDHYDAGVAARLAAAAPLRIHYCAGAPVESVPGAAMCPIAPGERVTVNGYSVKALAANHAEWPLHYDIETPDCRLFYGCDGAWLLHDTFYAMMERRYTAMVLDTTVGDYVGDYRMGEHNSLPMIRLMLPSFATAHVTTPATRIVLSHIARTLHAPHAELAAAAAAESMTAACDGLVLEVRDA